MLQGYTISNGFKLGQIYKQFGSPRNKMLLIL